MKNTFEQLPEAVAQLSDRLANIERLLLSQSNSEKPESSKLLSVEEAATHLNLAVPTVYSLVSRREIPFLKKSKRLYFLKQDLTNYILSGRNNSASEIEAEAVNSIIAKNKRG